MTAEKSFDVTDSAPLDETNVIGRVERVANLPGVKFYLDVATIRHPTVGEGAANQGKRPGAVARLPLLGAFSIVDCLTILPLPRRDRRIGQGNGDPDQHTGGLLQQVATDLRESSSLTRPDTVGEFAAHDPRSTTTPAASTATAAPRAANAPQRSCRSGATSGCTNIR